MRSHFNQFCSHWVDISERVLTKKDGLFRSGFRIREHRFGVHDEGTIDGRTQPMSMCMPKVRPALVPHTKLVCVRLPTTQRTLSYVRGSVRPVREHLPNSMPVCTHKYIFLIHRLDGSRFSMTVSKTIFTTSISLQVYLFTNVLRPHKKSERFPRLSHHSKEWFSSTNL